MLQRTSFLAIALVACLVPAAHAGAFAFGPLGQLPNGDPAKHPYWSGGEPSIAFDPSGDGHVYVSAPQFIPTAVDHAVSAGPDSAFGVAAWASADHGLSWPLAVNTGQQSLVESDRDHPRHTFRISRTISAGNRPVSGALPVRSARRS